MRLLGEGDKVRDDPLVANRAEHLLRPLGLVGKCVRASSAPSSAMIFPSLTIGRQRSVTVGWPSRRSFGLGAKRIGPVVGTTCSLRRMVSVYRPASRNVAQSGQEQAKDVFALGRKLRALLMPTMSNPRRR